MSDCSFPTPNAPDLTEGSAIADLELACSAVITHPQQPETWENLGQLLRRLRRPAEAAEALERWTALRPREPRAWERLGSARAAALQTPAALDAFQRALQLDPKHRAAWNNLGLLLHSQLHLQEALQAFRQAQTIDPDFAGSHVNEALTRLLLGDFSIGWLKFEYRWLLQGIDPRRGFSQPLWHPSLSLAGKRLLLHAEQGLGDTLHFARYAALLSDLGATVLLEVQPQLRSLLQTLPGPTAVLARGEPLPPFDLHCPLLSLPLPLGPHWTPLPQAVPYLTASPSLTALWRERLPTSKPLVGLVWRGNPGHHNDALRSAPLEALQPILNCSSCTFVNLQLPPNPAESQFLRALPHLVDLAPDIQSFDDTAALLASLDLLISVDTSVAHLGGALGRPVWILLPYAPDWRWGLHRSDCPTYPSARLFRPPAPAAWHALARTVRLELEKLAVSPKLP
jgi:hypothetical protein